MGDQSISLLRTANACFPGWRPGALKLKGRFLMAARTHRSDLSPYLSPATDSALGDMMAQRPQTLGILVWPYQCAGWDAAERLHRVQSHYRIIDRLGPPFRFPVHDKLVLSDLSELYPDLRIVLDQPKWFMREGGLVVNLFVGDFRAYSLAFSLSETADGDVHALVGSLQGRNTDDALGLYRDLTKALHGLRPRDMLLDVARILMRDIGVTALLAVSQDHRHHQHPFFGEKDLTPDYDAIWADRGGEKLDDMLWQLPLDPPQRDLAEVKPNKRSLYRKRYAFIEDLEIQILRTLPTVRPIRFTDT